MRDTNEIQMATWECLLRQVRKVLAHFGKEDFRGRADFLLIEDYFDNRRVTAHVQNLSLLRPTVIASLRSIIATQPGWEIVVAVDVPGKESWPLMGLMVRPHEIIDGLQRSYFPTEARSYSYPGSRPGTGLD